MAVERTVGYRDYDYKIGLLATPNFAVNLSKSTNVCFLPLQIAVGICHPIVVNGHPTSNVESAIMEARYGVHALRRAVACAWIKKRTDLKRLQILDRAQEYTTDLRYLL